MNENDSVGGVLPSWGEEVAKLSDQSTVRVENWASGMEDKWRGKYYYVLLLLLLNRAFPVSIYDIVSVSISCELPLYPNFSSSYTYVYLICLYLFYLKSPPPPTYLLTPWCRVLLEKLTGLQLVKNLPAFHGTRRFITALTSVRHLSVSWASPIQSIYPHPTSWTYILILSTHLRLGLPSGLFPSGFPTKTLHTPLSSPIRATCPAHLILFNFITRIILDEQYRSLISRAAHYLY